MKNECKNCAYLKAEFDAIKDTATTILAAVCISTLFVLACGFFYKEGQQAGVDAAFYYALDHGILLPTENRTILEYKHK